MSKANPLDGFDPAAPLDPAKALVPVTVRVNEQRVATGFLPKLKRVAARLPFATELVSVYYCARDPDTPATAKGLMLAALAYFVIPTDAIPDVLPMIGYTDDAAVIAAVIALLHRNIKPHHKDTARAFLDRIVRDA